MITWIENDLEYCAAHNKQLIVFLIDRAYWKKGAMPSYLKKHEFSDNGGFQPIRWEPEYIERLIALGQAIGERFDSHPNFEGVAIQESSISMSEESLEKFNYSPERYRDALITILNGLQDAMPGSRVFWYQNGLPQNKGHLRQVADSVAHSRVVMGGPDILPHRRWLRHTYRIYEEYKDKAVLFCSAQDDSFKHHKNDIRLSDIEPIHEEGYLTMEEIFLFARDKMHVKYLFWNYYYEGTQPGEHSFNDAIEVIRKYPTFNTTPDKHE